MIKSFIFTNRQIKTHPALRQIQGHPARDFSYRINKISQNSTGFYKGGSREKDESIMQN
jgi:hypothetical protein